MANIMYEYVSAPIAVRRKKPPTPFAALSLALQPTIVIVHLKATTGAALQSPHALGIGLLSTHPIVYQTRL